VLWQSPPLDAVQAPEGIPAHVHKVKPICTLFHDELYLVKGVRNRKKIGPSNYVADLALAQAKVKIAKGEYLGISEEKKLTLQQFASEYLAYSQANKRVNSYRRDCTTIERWLTLVFGDRYLFDIALAGGGSVQATAPRVGGPSNRE
jgi:hypothetical protein